jgi:tRNA G18 (ribose-2'-O)-methylase SpoU
MIPIDSLEDPRLADYRALKERELARGSGKFIAESEHVVRRLLASDFELDSVLVAKRRAEEISRIVPAHVPLYVIPDELIHQIVGFKFHSGVIACGRRKKTSLLEQLLPPGDQPSLLVVCPDLISHENLGSLIRISSAFGADAMILGPRCCDPFYRMSIRVSMGTVFSLPIHTSADLETDLRQLSKQWHYQLLATVLTRDAESLETVGPTRRKAILFGNEAQGLTPEHIALCDRKITIPMKRGTDSLNVAIAAGIFLYQLGR